MFDRSIAVMNVLDALSEMLRVLQLTGGLRYDLTLDSPWGFEVSEQKNKAPFYVVTQGECLIDLVGAGPDSRRRYGARLQTGDLAMLPLGTPHVLRDTANSPVVPLSSLAQRIDTSQARPTIRHGGDAAAANILVGEFRFNSPLAGAVIYGMDSIIYARSIGDETPPTFEPILRALCHEQRSNLPGLRAATDELLKLLFIHVIRREMARRRREPGSCKGTALALMFDPGLRGVAEMLHRFPDRLWTVAALAEEAHMSRTSFAVKFTETTGVSPFAYLTQVRMMNAIELLSTTNATLEEIAEQVGYGSEAAFATAFKREIGVAPGAYRHSRASAEDGAQ
jgi:AraC-like DNA-binding protein